MTNYVKDMTPEVKSDNEVVADMMNKLQEMNKIAVLKEDDFVIRSLLRGKPKTHIIKGINKRHKDDKISRKDLDKFIVLYKDVLQDEMVDTKKRYVRRLVKSKEGLTNELADLAIKAKDMVERYDNEGDNSNAVSALRAASDIFMKFAKVEGLSKDNPEVNVNMQMDKVVSEVTAGDSEFKDAVMRVIDKDEKPEKPIEGEYTVNED